MKYSVVLSAKFRRDLKKVSKQRKDLSLLDEVVEKLAAGEELPPKYKDHALTNSRNYKDARECHIRPDWLLVYEKYEDDLILLLLRTGSHSDLF